MDEKVKHDTSDSIVEMPIGAFIEEKGCLTVNGKIVAAYSANVREDITDIVRGERKPPVLHLSGCSRFTITPRTEHLRLAAVDHAAETLPLYGLSLAGREMTTRKPLRFCKTCLNRLRKASHRPDLVDRLEDTQDLGLFFEIAPTLQKNARVTPLSKPDSETPSWAKPYVKTPVSQPQGVRHATDIHGRVPLSDFDVKSAYPLITYDGQPAGAYQSAVGTDFHGILNGTVNPPKVHIAACVSMRKSAMSADRLRPVVGPADKLPISAPRHTETALMAVPFCKNCLAMLRKATNHSPLIEELEKNPSMTLFYKLLPSIREQIEAKKARDESNKHYWLSKKTQLVEQISSTTKSPRTKTPAVTYHDNACPVPNGEGLTFPGGLIAYQGEPAVLFRDRTSRRYDQIEAGLRSPGLFHFVNCANIRLLQEEKSRLANFFTSTDQSTTFTVHGYSEKCGQNKTSKHVFRPCINCLKRINWANSLGRGTALTETSPEVANFKATDFFCQYHSVFSDRSPLTKDEIANYFKNRRPGFARRARAAKVAEGWRCRHCGVNLSTHQWLLRAVERQGDTMPLCIACYRQAVGRPPLGVGYQDFRRLDQLRHDQKLMPIYDWTGALRAADPALRDAMKLALAAGYAPPEINTPIDLTDVSAPVPDLIWRNERIAVSLRIPVRHRYRDWWILPPTGLIALLRQLSTLPTPEVPDDEETEEDLDD